MKMRNFANSMLLALVSFTGGCTSSKLNNHPSASINASQVPSSTYVKHSVTLAGKPGQLARSADGLMFTYKTNGDIRSEGAIWPEVEQIWWRLKSMADEAHLKNAFIVVIKSPQHSAVKGHREIKFGFHKYQDAGGWVVSNKIDAVPQGKATHTG